MSDEKMELIDNGPTDLQIAALPEDAQKAVREAMAKGEKVTIDDNGNVFIGGNGKGVDIAAKPAKVSKIEEKRMRNYLERRQRLLNKGVRPEDVDKVMAAEDYEALSPGQKVKRLEVMVSKSVNALAKEMLKLRANDGSIADAFEINYRAIAMMFERLGLSMEEQGKITKLAEEEVQKETEAKIAAKKAAEQKMAEVKAASTEQASVEAEAKENPTESGETQMGHQVSEGATVFGSSES